MDVAEILAIVKDIVLTIAAVIASYIAIGGLDTWRRQLSGNVEYQLAKNILTTLYALRDAIETVRDPLMSYSAEPDLPEEKLKNLTRPEKEWHGLVQAYQKRWEAIPVAKTRLNANLWEAEAVWGKAITSKIQPLMTMLNELFWAVRTHLEATNPKHEDREESADLLAKTTSYSLCRQY